MSGVAVSVSGMAATVAPAPACPGGTAGAAAPEGLVTVEAMAAELSGMGARLGELTDAATADIREGERVVDAARIDAIAVCERIQAAAAATQATLMVRFGRSGCAPRRTP